MKKEENLRESIQNMVSSIDDVSFGESKKFITKNSDPTNCSPIKNGPSSPKPTPMEVDIPPNSNATHSPINLTPAVNGFSGSSRQEPPKNETLVAGVNGDAASSGPELNSRNCDLNSTVSPPFVNGIVLTSTDVLPANKALSLTPASSSQQQQGHVAANTRPESNSQVNIIQVKRKRPMEELKPPSQPNKKKFTPQSLRTFPTKKLEESPVPTEASVTPHSRTPSTPKSGCSTKSRLPPLKIDTTFAFQVCKEKMETIFDVEI